MKVSRTSIITAEEAFVPLSQSPPPEAVEPQPPPVLAENWLIRGEIDIVLVVESHPPRRGR